jgi:hypothetical protein
MSSVNCISSPSYTFSGNTVNISSGLTVGGTIPSFTTSQISAIDTYSVYPVEWETSFPDWNKIQNMCKEYPGLAIAFDKFKTTYKLVRDDYDTPKDKRPRP